MKSSRRFFEEDAEEDGGGKAATIVDVGVERRLAARLGFAAERCYQALESASRYVLLIVPFALFLFIAANSSDVRIRFFLDTELSRATIVILSEVALVFVLGHISTLYGYATAEFRYIFQSYEAVKEDWKDHYTPSIDRFVDLMFTGLGMFNPLAGYYLRGWSNEQPYSNNALVALLQRARRLINWCANGLIKVFRFFFGNLKSLVIVLLLSATVGLVTQQVSWSFEATMCGAHPSAQDAAMCARRGFNHFPTARGWIGPGIEVALLLPLVTVLIATTLHLARLLRISAQLFNTLFERRVWPSSVSVIYYLIALGIVFFFMFAGFFNYLPGSEIFTSDRVTSDLFRDIRSAFGFK